MHIEFLIDWGGGALERAWRLAHGPVALWKKSEEKPLLCEHNAASPLTFSAVLFAFVDIIPQIGRGGKYWFGGVIFFLHI